MFFNIFFDANNFFEEAFSKQNLGNALFIVLLAGLFFALTIFSLTNEIILSLFSFLTNLINWVILSLVVFFFWVAHNSKKKKTNQKISLNNFFSVVGSLWVINLLSYLVLFIGVVLLTNLYGFIFFDLVALIFLVGIVLLIGFWVVSSFRMLRVLFESSFKKTLINWVILMFLNSLIAFLFSRVLSLFLL